MSPITLSADFSLIWIEGKNNNKQESKQDSMLRLKFFGYSEDAAAAAGNISVLGSAASKKAIGITDS